MPAKRKNARLLKTLSPYDRLLGHIMYLSLLARGTIAEGAALSAVRIPLRARCRACGRESELTVTHLACPACGGTDLEVLSGREFYIDSLEVDPLGNQSSASGDGMEPAGR